MIYVNINQSEIPLLGWKDKADGKVRLSLDNKYGLTQGSLHSLVANTPYEWIE